MSLTNKSYPSKTHLTISSAEHFRTGFATVYYGTSPHGDPKIAVLSRAAFCSLFAQFAESDLAIVEDRVLCTHYIRKEEYKDWELVRAYFKSYEVPDAFCLLGERNE